MVCPSGCMWPAYSSNCTAGRKLAVFQGELQKQPGSNCCQMYKACCGLSLHNALVIGNRNCWNPKCCDNNYKGLQFLYPWSGGNVGSVSPQRHVAFLKIACWLLLDLECVCVAVSPYSRVFFTRCTEKVKYNHSLMFLEGEIVDSKSFLCVCGCI